MEKKIRTVRTDENPPSEKETGVNAPTDPENPLLEDEEPGLVSDDEPTPKPPNEIPPPGEGP